MTNTNRGIALEERLPLTIRLLQSDIASLDRMATEGMATRQDIIERIIRQAIANFAPGASQHDDLPLPPSVSRAIMNSLDRMRPGDEASLKTMIGKDLWATLDDPLRRGLGKTFKLLVESGSVSGLMMGRKKSNNEQQYSKL